MTNTPRLGRSPGDLDGLAGGDSRNPVEAEEMWAFVPRRGGKWLLSAIQHLTRPAEARLRCGPVRGRTPT
jgi:hypothetical protein